MKICILSHEYPPFPGGGISTYCDAFANNMRNTNHEIHIITNSATYGHNEPRFTQRCWKDGNLTVHRLDYFDDKQNFLPDTQFLDVNPQKYAGDTERWTLDPSNIAALQAAAYIEMLHAEIDFDIIETPEYYAEGFYIIRRKHSGTKNVFPPICIHGHMSSHLAFTYTKYIFGLGNTMLRQRILREKYCIQNAEALLTPSHCLMEKYQEQFGENLPKTRAVIPYFLDIPDNLPPPPHELADNSPYLALVGRIEPRKGSDIALKAFTQIADEFPKLKLVFLGRESWGHGKSFTDIINHIVAPRHKNRILQLGNLPREKALATVKKATAFLHPAPWDNYPCAVMEAMGVGATCIVSTQGGHSEMIQDGVSGLLSPYDNLDSLVNNIRKVLTNNELRQELSKNAQNRIKTISDPAIITEKKMEFFSAVIEAAKENIKISEKKEPSPDSETTPLPGKGLVFIDGGSAKEDAIRITVESILDETKSSNGWNIAVLVEPDNTTSLPKGCTRVSVEDDPPWLKLSDDDFFVYVTAGTRFDKNSMLHMINQVENSPIPCGSFPWLRPASAKTFPYSPDISFFDLLINGVIIPPVFCVRASRIRICTHLSNLFRPDLRACGLLAAISAAGKLTLRHTGDAEGDYYDELSIVNQEIQKMTTGYLDVLGLIPAEYTDFGSRENQLYQEDKAESCNINTEYLTEIEKIYKEYSHLHQMRISCLLRKIGFFRLVKYLCKIPQN